MGAQPDINTTAFTSVTNDWLDYTISGPRDVAAPPAAAASNDRPGGNGSGHGGGPLLGTPAVHRVHRGASTASSRGMDGRPTQRHRHQTPDRVASVEGNDTPSGEGDHHSVPSPGPLGDAQHTDLDEEWLQSSEEPTDNDDSSDDEVNADEIMSTDSNELHSHSTSSDVDNLQKGSRKKTTAYVKVASENMRGRGSPQIGGNTKWRRIAESVREQRIGILALQETHLAPEHVDDIHMLHSHLHVINTAIPNNPTGSGGVAVVLNKHLTNHASARHRVLIPGRALLVSVEWTRGCKLTLVVVYAPTTRRENDAMWKTLLRELKKSRPEFPKPDVLMGDFNFVEDPVDRYPAKISKLDEPGNFAALKRYLKVIDGWRNTFPSRVEYTWRNAARSAMSRIDRIYATRSMVLASRGWATAISELTENDHSRILTEFTNYAAPKIGEGRWTMRSHLMKDKAFSDAAYTAGLHAQAAMKLCLQHGRTARSNPQTIWQDFKESIVDSAKERMKKIACARGTLDRKQEETRQQASQSLRSALTDEEVIAARAELTKAEQAIHATATKRYDDRFELRNIKTFMEAETVSKSWFRWTKEAKPAEMLVQLRKPDSEPAQYVQSSRRMAEIAGEYHDRIQSKDLDVDAQAREQAILRALEHVETQLTPAESEALGAAVQSEEARDAIACAKNGKAAGTDGIIYEFWKHLEERGRSPPPGDATRLDCASMMEAVFQDITVYGLTEGSRFTEGWLCPLYKKGDRTDIANYRPITLLNTDYKLFTKVLAMRLAAVAPRIIHESQAGFIRGRSITDQTKIAALMLSFAEAEEANGAIVALDQEKAYDRVRHDYLLRVLERFGIPESFRTIISHLYGSAYTSVMVNGMLSPRFQVTRGVRQGDPLLCLLFNLAIEPLSAMLRRSDLRGFEISGLKEKLIASLYADDTTVYLNADDSYELLQEILASWCLAAGARFNIAKTEVIPLGRPSYREQLIEDRKLGVDGIVLPENIRIARDGKPTRILGTWPGNGLLNVNAWTVIIDRVDLALQTWSKRSPKLAGKSLLTRVIAGGHTQYLTAAQGMPTKIEERLDKLVLDFIWKGKKGRPVNMDTLRNTKERGGLEVFHAAARNDAQYITWLGAYLLPEGQRPPWAFIADHVFRAFMTVKDKRRIPEHARLNPFCQDWTPFVRKLPFILQQLVRVAKKYHLVLDAPEIAPEVRGAMTVWGHYAMRDPMVTRAGRPGVRCLKTHHAVTTVEDLEEIAEQTEDDHEDVTNCGCEDCEADRSEGCNKPYRCQALARDILSEIAPRWNPSTVVYGAAEELQEQFGPADAATIKAGEMVVVNSALHRGTQLESYYRIFANSLALTNLSAKDLRHRDAPERCYEEIDSDPATAVAVAAIDTGNSEEARGGLAAYFPTQDAPDMTGRCPGPPTTYLGCTALAIMAAATQAPANRTLHIVTKSRQIVEVLTTTRARHENRGWLDFPEDPENLRAAAAALRRRRAETTLTFVDKKRCKDWPEVRDARQMAAVAAELGPMLILEPDDLVNFDTPGMYTAGIRQRDAHRAIRQALADRTPLRKVTLANLQRTQRAVEELCGHVPTHKQIWASLQHKDISRGAREFLWKTMHGAHKVGEYFSKMSQPWKDYERCPTCNCVESMTHILIECPVGSPAVLWKLAQLFLLKKKIAAEISIGFILGCAAMRLSETFGTMGNAVERAMRIVVSETAFLIWKIRCETRVGHADEPNWRISADTAASRWEQVISARMRQDKLLTDKSLFGKRALETWLETGTWLNMTDPANETYYKSAPGVLVGIGDIRREGIG